MNLLWQQKLCNLQQLKKAPFSRTAAHIFVSAGDAPATITQYVAWMERQFNACQTPRSMYLSIFNSFRVKRCLSQCVSPKIHERDGQTDGQTLHDSKDCAYASHRAVMKDFLVKS